MAFRDHLGAAVSVNEPISLVHGLWRWSYANGGAMAVFESLEEAPGHRAAVNMLTRDRLCAAIGIEPEAYIDTLGWAMANPQEPVMVPESEAEVYEIRRERLNSVRSPSLTIGPKMPAATCPRPSSSPTMENDATSVSTVNCSETTSTSWFALFLGTSAPWWTKPAPRART